MAELLFEIFCEEIPARMQVRAGADLAKALSAGLSAAGLKLTDARVLSGPRRLTYVASVPLRSPDISEERKGPRVGSPPQALAGFLRGAGLSDISEAQIKTDPKKGEFYVAVIEKAGIDTADILHTLIPEVMNNFPWPKSMRSGSSGKSGGSNFRWVRPLQSMICLLGGNIVPVSVGGVTASNVTEGHRRHGKGPFTISGFADYKEQLETKGHVILSADDRKAVILKDAVAACTAAGLELVEDDGLLSEVAGLVEWPVVILGDMEPSFLELPGEVIRLSMRAHQKYFAVRDPKTNTLAPNFIVVANQAAPDGGKEIALGNSRVLSARLADAQFFQSEDAKKNLEDYYDKLDTVVFHKKLGSIRDKAERVAGLAKALAPIIGADVDKCAQAAKLAKCDLVTNMVVEFTSLQGQIGAQMYQAEGGDSDIALAIEQHYKPQGPSDEVPTNPVAVTVALADKLDTLVGFWAIDEKPTGSKDPFALRRAALGVVRIVLENDVRLDLTKVITLNATAPVFADIAANTPNQNLDAESGKLRITGGAREKAVSKNTLHAFILDRLKGLLRDKGVAHDHIDAVFALSTEVGGGDDLLDITKRIEALGGFLSTDAGADLLAGYKRAANILKAEAKKGELPTGVPNKPNEKDGAALFAALTTATPKIDAALAAEDYQGAMSALAELRGPIDSFFENTRVVAEDKDERENNLKLLMLIRDTASKIADFEKISG